MPQQRLRVKNTLGIALAVLSVLLATMTAHHASAQARSYRSRDGGPLSLSDDEQVLRALGEGEILKEEILGSGTTGVKRLEIRHNDVVIRAVFRHVDFYEKDLRLRDGTTFAGFYDRYSAECAAYELGRLLRLDSIPPAVLRRVGDQNGSVQLWIEGAMTEGDRAERSLTPPDHLKWRAHQAALRAFDALIANADRNVGNSLIDADWNLWLIDHSRAFQIPRGTPSLAQVNQIPVAFWDALRTLDHDAVRARLRDYLEPAQLRSLFERHERLVAHFEAMIADRGREAVVIE